MKPAPSLLDVVAQRGQITLRGVTLPVDGLSIEAIAALAGRFEVLRDLFAGGGALSIGDLIKAGPPVVAAIVAAGLGHAGNADHERAAGALTLDEQIAVLSVVFERTFPGGVPNLIGRLRVLATAAGLEEAEPAKVVQADPTPAVS